MLSTRQLGNPHFVTTSTCRRRGFYATSSPPCTDISRVQSLGTPHPRRSALLATSDSVVVTHECLSGLLLGRRLSIPEAIRTLSISTQLWRNCFVHVIQLVITGSMPVTLHTAANLVTMWTGPYRNLASCEVGKLTNSIIIRVRLWDIYQSVVNRAVIPAKMFSMSATLKYSSIWACIVPNPADVLLKQRGCLGRIDTEFFFCSANFACSFQCFAVGLAMCHTPGQQLNPPKYGKGIGWCIIYDFLVILRRAVKEALPLGRGGSGAQDCM